MISALILALMMPCLLLVSLLIWMQLGFPVLFRQERPGLHGIPFLLFKFRTMNDRRGPDGQLLPDMERLTRLGSWIRRMSLDEFPQLINVIKGEMSLVGPRPLLKRYLDRYSPQQARRHEVKPGITGWAQVNGRNAISWEEKFTYDVWYVDHQGFWLDIKILWLTLLKVLSRQGINASDEEPMPEFIQSIMDNKTANNNLVSPSPTAPAKIINTSIKKG